MREGKENNISFLEALGCKLSQIFLQIILGKMTHAEHLDIYLKDKYNSYYERADKEGLMIKADDIQL